LRRFSAGKYGRQSLEFHPAPFRAPLRSFAALVFPWYQDKILLCDIEDRGWCIPSGRVEPDESSWEAALREAQEEAGAILSEMQYIGCYRITERREVRWADVFVARVVKLVELNPEFESRGRRMVTLAELPEIYHQWNDLTYEVFCHSRAVLDRHDAAVKANPDLQDPL
jgi:8-oxo-dGTP diphosphatase